ncbi:hypothetical protein ACHQM5_000860 [Ranunculus cassubicifolius]
MIVRVCLVLAVGIKKDSSMGMTVVAQVSSNKSLIGLKRFNLLNSDQAFGSTSLPDILRSILLVYLIGSGFKKRGKSASMWKTKID